MNVPEPVRRQAVHPFLRAAAAPRTISGCAVAGVQVALTPVADGADRRGARPGARRRRGGRCGARARARARQGRRSAWWIAPEHDHLAPLLEEHGLVNEDTPGFEAVENAMALVEPPGRARRCPASRSRRSRRSTTTSRRRGSARRCSGCRAAGGRAARCGSRDAGLAELRARSSRGSTGGPSEARSPRSATPA